LAASLAENPRIVARFFQAFQASRREGPIPELLTGQDDLIVEGGRPIASIQRETRCHGTELTGREWRVIAAGQSSPPSGQSLLLKGLLGLDAFNLPLQVLYVHGSNRPRVGGV
jgi:hypothetical protein